MNVPPELDSGRYRCSKVVTLSLGSFSVKSSCIVIKTKWALLLA